MSNRLPDGHVWRRRELDIDGEEYSQRHCQNCGRDFVTKTRLEQWHAVYVGVFEFIPLEQDMNSRWLNEPCPGRRLPEEYNELRSRKPLTGGDAEGS